MEVTCTQCNAKLNIPDDKIPVGQTVRINCPKCKAKITIDTRESTPDRPPQGDPPIETGKAPPGSVESKSEEDPGEGASLFEDQSGDEALDFFSEDAELALNCGDFPHCRRVLSDLAEQDWGPEEAERVDALRDGCL